MGFDATDVVTICVPIPNEVRLPGCPFAHTLTARCAPCPTNPGDTAQIDESSHVLAELALSRIGRVLQGFLCLRLFGDVLATESDKV